MRNSILLVCTFTLCCALVEVTGISNPENCYSGVINTCSSEIKDSKDCTAKYSDIGEAVSSLQEYVYQHIINNYIYLSMATNFNSYKRNRAGFEKFFRHLSDEAWEDAIDIIKYLGKRGHKMSFNKSYDCSVEFEVGKKNSTTQVNCKDALALSENRDELKSLATTLDLYKKLAHKAHKIHAEATTRKEKKHDAEILSYIEEKFVHRHSNKIRTISGHLNDLLYLVHGENNSDQRRLAVYLFDEYIGKTI